MVMGNHVARCRDCGAEWMVGDCIPSQCGECQELERLAGEFAEWQIPAGADSPVELVEQLRAAYKIGFLTGHRQGRQTR